MPLNDSLSLAASKGMFVGSNETGQGLASGQNTGTLRAPHQCSSSR
uniref:Uncharacterized protein n=1 Tax=Anguilla anguilla TaxID=7936 RepID=A0A0E9RF06_ANGAN